MSTSNMGFRAQIISLQNMLRHHWNKISSHLPTTTLISLDWFMQ